ncbi:hypothetical protein NQ317_013804 [Molorchus minor]|uniref:Uncharacterized protein n=1 Tax=Molorchus minor TaxID=1323400 RepID=A0ABQ9J490_9CUCU|nr:hypothetical protein NQ317_013804 [Molorchus minor]
MAQHGRVPYLIDHYYGDPSEDVKTEFKAAKNMDQNIRSNGSAQSNQSSKKNGRWKKTMSCMNVRNLPGCKQSLTNPRHLLFLLLIYF